MNTKEAQPSGVVLPDGWVQLTIEHEPGYPEDVAFGPRRMMDRLKKWLDRYFEMRLNSSPVSACDNRKLSDIGNELHNLSCHVVHHNEGWANQLGALASELWYWSASSGVMDERAAFEAAYLKANYPRVHSGELSAPPIFVKTKAGEYDDPDMQRAWIMWQARAALSAPSHGEQVERLQMQLVACGVVALANTPESAARARDMHPDYMSASCSDVMRAVDREMHQRADLLDWAVERWHAEVSQRPLVNVNRRSIDDTWRQIIRRLGGDPVDLCGPDHDTLIAAAPSAASQGGDV